MSRKILSGLTIFAFLALAPVLRADDLSAIAQRIEIAAQKLTKEVNDALTASKATKANPADSKTTLQDLLRRVSNSDDLKASQKAELENRLRARLREVENLATRQRLQQEQAPAPALERPRNPATPPTSGAASSAARGFIDSAKGSLASQQEIDKQRRSGYLKTGSAADKFEMPGESGIALPKNWAAITARRAPSLSTKEVALLKALNSVISVDYDHKEVRDVIDHLQTKTGLTIIIDEASRQDANLEYNDQITFQAPKASVRTVLKKVFGDKGLTYVIKEAAIHVVTAKRAGEMMVIRSYPVDDLVTPPQMVNPFVARYQMLNSATQLINLIQSSIEPSNWQANGGPATITFFEPTKSIVVRASAEMHYQLGGQGLLGR